MPITRGRCGIGQQHSLDPRRDNISYLLPNPVYIALLDKRCDKNWLRSAWHLQMIWYQFGCSFQATNGARSGILRDVFL